MKIYIAGKVSGLPYHKVSMKFGKHEKKLLEDGHEPVVPLNIVDRNDTWETAMRKCIAALCGCDAIHMLADWEQSRGAKLEHELALDLNIPVTYLI